MKKAQGQRSEPGKVAGLKTWGKVWHAVSVMSVCRYRCCMTLDYAIRRNRIENIILIIMNSTVSESTWPCPCLQGIHEHVSDKVLSFLKSTDFPGIKFCLNDRIFSPTFLHCCRWKKRKEKKRQVHFTCFPLLLHVVHRRSPLWLWPFLSIHHKFCYNYHKSSWISYCCFI